MGTGAPPRRTCSKGIVATRSGRVWRIQRTGCRCMCDCDTALPSRRSNLRGLLETGHSRRCRSKESFRRADGRRSKWTCVIVYLQSTSRYNQVVSRLGRRQSADGAPGGFSFSQHPKIEAPASPHQESPNPVFHGDRAIEMQTPHTAVVVATVPAIVSAPPSGRRIGSRPQRTKAESLSHCSDQSLLTTSFWNPLTTAAGSRNLVRLPGTIPS
jgi:hypothetical protein